VKIEGVLRKHDPVSFKLWFALQLARFRCTAAMQRLPATENSCKGVFSYQQSFKKSFDY
jgi:hypothetical protein